MMDRDSNCESNVMLMFLKYAQYSFIKYSLNLINFDAVNLKVVHLLHHHHPLCPSSIQTLLSRIEISLEISEISSTFLIVLGSIGVLNLFYITLLL